MQLQAARDCFCKAKEHKASWVLFTDFDDEFLYIDSSSLPAFFDSYSRYSFLTLCIFVYNASIFDPGVNPPPAYIDISHRFKEPFCCTTRSGGFIVASGWTTVELNVPQAISRTGTLCQLLWQTETPCRYQQRSPTPAEFYSFSSHPDGLDADISKVRINEIPVLPRR